MKSETVAVHGGYESDPTTKAVAVPIYQTVAYEFDSADHGAALFNLEVEGYRYSRISNPTTAVLERRVAALEGGVEALCVATGPGGAELRDAQSRRAWAATSSRCRSSTAPPTRCSRTSCRARASPCASPNPTAPDAIEKLIDDKTRAIFCESVGNPAGNICDIEALAAVAAAARRAARRRQHGGDADPAAPDRIRRRHRRAFADQIHGRPRHDARRRHRRFRPLSAGRSTPAVSRCSTSRTRPITASSTPSISAPRAYIARCRSVYQRTTGAVLSPLSAFLLLQGIETVALRVERHVENARRVAEFLRDDPRVAWVNYAGFADNPYHALAQKYLGGRACSLLTFGVAGGLEAGKALLRRAEAVQAAGQYGRRQVARLPSGLDHASADVGGGAAQGRREAGDDPALRRHRARRRHHRRSRSGAGGVAATPRR